MLSKEALEPDKLACGGILLLDVLKQQRNRYQQPLPTQGPKRRQSKRSISKPQSPGGSALEEETLEAAFASFEEWPLEAVLKRVWVDGSLRGMIVRIMDDMAAHRKACGASHGRTSLTGRALPSGVAPTAEGVQGDEYFEVEDIWDYRLGEEGREDLVKWAGYGHKDNTWEPAAHFEQCPEILQQFHQREGLPTSSWMRI